MVRTLSFHAGGLRFNLWSGSKLLCAMLYGCKKKKKKGGGGKNQISKHIMDNGELVSLSQRRDLHIWEGRRPE